MTTATTDKALPRCEQCHAELLPDIGHPDYQKHACQPPEAATPRPWVVGKRGRIQTEANAQGGCTVIVDEQSIGDYRNAQLIVRAVNAHDGLVAALETIRDAGETWTADFYEVKRIAREALKLARGE